MNIKIRHIKLNRYEIEYLRSADFLPPAIKELFEVIEGRENVGDIFAVSESIAEHAREIFTERLGRVGFDARYELTQEGQMLEELIDRFHT